MKTEYLRTAKNSYMIVKDADFEFESYELEMVLQNDLKNLVPMQVLVADGKVEYWFDVTGMKTLEQELSVADADREMIKLLLESICSVKMELEEYLLDDKDIYGGIDLNILRKRVGMVFQKPNPFPMSIYDNIAFGPRTHGIRQKAKLDEIVEKSLRNAAIWDELKDRLKKSALGLSGGQQQRLCIARALAVEPEVLLMDEPTSALDPISTAKIEDLAVQLKNEYTIVMVTHNMQQATRIADKTAFFLMGEVVEYNDTETLFSTPKDRRCEDYITGRFG